MNLKLEVISENGIISLNKNNAESLGIDKLSYTIARFGYGITDVELRIDESLSDDIMLVGENITKRLHLPENNRYLLKVEDKEIVFGPLMGIFLGMENLNYNWKYERLESFITNYEEINGVVCAFSEKDLDLSKMTVNAYYYDAYYKIWRKQILPLPSTLNVFGNISKRLKRLLRGIYGNNLYNYSEMDKWAESKVLQRHPLASVYLPETIISSNVEMFKDFVDKHEDVYFKPIKGRQGKGIHRIYKQQDNSYTLTIQAVEAKEYKNVNFEDIDVLINELKDKIISSQFILQKTINLIINNRVIDFRLRFDKNIENEWKLSLAASRVSDIGGVVSNRSAGGKVVSVEQSLEEYYGYSESEAKNKKNELIKAGKILTEAVEENNVNYGKCAVDLGVDNDGNIWHIESNIKAPNDTTTLSFEKYEGLDRVCQLGISYNKRLAGFKNVNNTIEILPSGRKSALTTAKSSYELFLTGQFMSEKFVNYIKEETTNFVNKNFSLKKRKSYVLLTLKNISEKELVDLVYRIRKQDNYNVVRTVLYNKVNKKIKKVKQSKNDELKKKNEEIEKELKELNKEIKKMKNSNSWKMTAPIRIIGKVLKRK